MHRHREFTPYAAHITGKVRRRRCTSGLRGFRELDRPVVLGTLYCWPWYPSYPLRKVRSIPYEQTIMTTLNFGHGMEWATNRSENSERLPLLATKLHAARTRPDVVSRPRLAARLDEGCRRKLTIVSAPAGFGKTTLLSQWANSSKQNVAWMSLDEGDNIPVRFWTYFIGSLQRLRAGIGASALESLYLLQPPPTEVILTALINDLTQMPGEIALVLDDYHTIELEPIHAALAFFIDHMPAQMHMFIASRMDPRLQVTRLRARGELIEIRAADLRFTHREATELLENVAGKELSADEISRLVAQTEGWGACLQLTGLAMQGRRHANGRLRALTGTHRYVADYILTEILDRQPEPIRSFLLKTSILDRLNGSLCNAVLGMDGGEEMLPSLEQANLFLTLIEEDEDEEWYRYHGLFAEVLRDRLRQLYPLEMQALHLRASQWFEHHGYAQEAIQHLLKGGETEQAIRLAERNVETLLATGKLDAILQWREAFPAEQIQNRPRLALAFAWALVLSGQFDAADTYLDYCRRFVQPDPHDGLSDIPAHLATLHSFLATSRVATERAQTETEEIPRSRSGVSAFSAPIFNLEPGHQVRRGTPQKEQEIETGAKIREHHERFGLIEALPRMARLQITMGQLRASAGTYQQAMAHFDEHPGAVAQEWRSLALCHTGLGEIYYQRNELDVAMRHLAEALKLCRLGSDAAVIHDSYTLLARMHQARGDTDGALDAIAEAEELLKTAGGTGQSMLWLPAHTAQIHLMQGNIQAAVRWALEQPSERPLYIDEMECFQQITLARVALAQYKTEMAIAILTPLLEIAEIRGWNHSRIYGLALQALALEQQGDTDQAILALVRALALAEPEGYIRAFVDEGTPMMRLLRRLRESRESEEAESLTEIGVDYIDRILAALGVSSRGEWESVRRNGSTPSSHTAIPSASLLTPVSEREVEVLQLIAEGKTNASIAEQLYISISTVKTHINNLYSKLGVESRTQALARAKELHLL